MLKGSNLKNLETFGEFKKLKNLNFKDQDSANKLHLFIEFIGHTINSTLFGIFSSEPVS